MEFAGTQDREATYEELLELEDVKVTASDAAVQRLRQVKVGNADFASVIESACLVCQEDWQQGEEVLTLHCQHSFHKACIQRWLKEYSNKCPICKDAVQ
jgi:E3 ubiquitin-protein ligase Arkadia